MTPTLAGPAWLTKSGWLKAPLATPKMALSSTCSSRRVRATSTPSRKYPVNIATSGAMALSRFTSVLRSAAATLYGMRPTTWKPVSVQNRSRWSAMEVPKRLWSYINATVCTGDRSESCFRYVTASRAMVRALGCTRNV